MSTGDRILSRDQMDAALRCAHPEGLGRLSRPTPADLHAMERGGYHIPADPEETVARAEAALAAAGAHLVTDSEARKHIPLATGLFDYFPDALAAVAECSYLSNEKHNPGEPLHWSREKSNDHDDCLLRHFLERGTIDTDNIRHRTKIAWRSLAALQLEIEAARGGTP